MTQEALKLALEALETPWNAPYVDGCDLALGKKVKAITALREALAQTEQEPVALYVYKPTLPRGHLGNVSDGDLPWVYDQDPSSGYTARMLVYTAPPQRKPQEFVCSTGLCHYRKPLSNEEIDKLWCELPPGTLLSDELNAFARAIEAAHNIKE